MMSFSVKSLPRKSLVITFSGTILFFLIIMPFILNNTSETKDAIKASVGAIAFPREEAGTVKIFLQHIENLQATDAFRKQLMAKAQQIWNKGYISVDNSGLPLMPEYNLVENSQPLTKEMDKASAWRQPLDVFQRLNMKYVGVTQVSKKFIGRVFLHGDSTVLLLETLNNPAEDHIEFPIEMVNEHVDGLPATFLPYLTKDNRMMITVNWVKGNILYALYWDQKNTNTIPYEIVKNIVDSIANTET